MATVAENIKIMSDSITKYISFRSDFLCACNICSELRTCSHIICDAFINLCSAEILGNNLFQQKVGVDLNLCTETCSHANFSPKIRVLSSKSPKEMCCTRGNVMLI